MGKNIAAIKENIQIQLKGDSKYAQRTSVRYMGTCTGEAAKKHKK